MKLLENKIAIVTGAARGIGEAIALKLAEHGAHIAFTYVSEGSAEKAAALVTKLQGMGVKAKAWRSNAGNFAESEAFVNDVVKEFGTVDVCINNAGISKDNLLLRMTPEQWDEVMEVNLKSVFNMTKQVIKPMMKAKRGSIINMSSIIGIRGNAGQSSYAASKAGIIGFTKSVALELGSRNIRCNAILPGLVLSPVARAQMTEAQLAMIQRHVLLPRESVANDIAGAVLWLASDHGSFVTGQIISVDGGICHHQPHYADMMEMMAAANAA
jgi:3-oxoacyl-[acyl-carrier protein] reductase